MYKVAFREAFRVYFNSNPRAIYRRRRVHAREQYTH